MVGGPQSVARRCEPLFGSFSRHVVYLGGPGSGQAAKLFNNALLSKLDNVTADEHVLWRAGVITMDTV
jgi:3-hydroxyisobutyrate dehydrogenase-like beta-hydroxyacid dehydrogenase